MRESMKPSYAVRSLKWVARGGEPVSENAALCNELQKVFVVSDGFGGPVAGLNAAKQASEAIQDFLCTQAGDREATLPFVLRNYFSLAGNVLYNAVIFANRRLNKLNDRKTLNERGGASAIAALVDGEFLALAQVGCCSAWLYRGDREKELVAPRSYGALRDPFSFRRDGLHRVPLMALGMEEDLEPEISEFLLKRGDWLLLATQGLPEAVRILIREVRGMARESALDELIRGMQAIEREGNEIGFSCALITVG